MSNAPEHMPASPGAGGFLRVGVTGGIGSGKSTVCRMFASLGRSVISADDLARDLTETDPAIKKAVRDTFGASVFLPDGRLDRKAVANLVFTNTSLRKKLDAIIHPHVFAGIEERIDRMSPAERSPFVIIEAALIYETGMDKRLDYVLVVTAEEEHRIERVMRRDNVRRDDVLARIQSQMDPARKTLAADFVISNEGPEENLLESVRFFDRLLTSLARTSPASKKDA